MTPRSTAVTVADPAELEGAVRGLQYREEAARARPRCSRKAGRGREAADGHVDIANLAANAVRTAQFRSFAAAALYASVEELKDWDDTPPRSRATRRRPGWIVVLHDRQRCVDRSAELSAASE